jgi:hypothetical protein
MSGPMQWNQALGRLVPAITSADEGVKWHVKDDELQVEEPAPPPALRKPAPKAAPPAPKNILTLAKARLREIKTELRKLKALEKERGELERLIAAAEDKKPRAVVRELKRTAG